MVQTRVRLVHADEVDTELLEVTDITLAAIGVGERVEFGNGTIGLCLRGAVVGRVSGSLDEEAVTGGRVEEIWTFANNGSKSGRGCGEDRRSSGGEERQRKHGGEPTVVRPKS